MIERDYKKRIDMVDEFSDEFIIDLTQFHVRKLQKHGINFDFSQFN